MGPREQHRHGGMGPAKVTTRTRSSDLAHLLFLIVLDRSCHVDG